MNSSMIIILGVTASGKSRLAFELAKKLDAEIISIDSMKIYRRMDIGTAKPLPQVRKEIPYHLIDVVEPSESFSVARFLSLADESIEQIRGKGKPVIAVGGTALYLKTLLYGLFEGPGENEQIRNRLRKRAKHDGLEILHEELTKIDPEAAQNISFNDEKRIIRALEVFELTGRPISSMQKQFDANTTRHDWTIIGLRRSKEIESMRINARVKKMMDEGLLEEVESLLAEEIPLSKQARCAIGYAELINYLQGHGNLEEAVENIKKNTRRLAKGQRTWFKRFQNVNWIDAREDENNKQILARTFELLDKDT
ncbi:MAG: tRNA (adenosine(37)-N6)-dimethylallyltransferase MiaA [Planctomycetota bacterium]|jgi:tRNA dimethylallyltransferase